MIAYRMSRPITNQLSAAFRISKRKKYIAKDIIFDIIGLKPIYNFHYHDIRLRKHLWESTCKHIDLAFCSANQKGSPEPYNLKLVNTELSIPMRALGNHGNQCYIVAITYQTDRSKLSCNLMEHVI